MAKDPKEKTTPELPLEPVAPTPHVLLAVASITAKMAESGIKKSTGKEGSRIDYKFRKIDDVFNSLASEYVADKVIVLPAYANRVANEYQSKSGGRMVSVTVEGTYRIVSLVDGSEIVSGPFIGEGMDSGDKATNKAMSIAYKYFAGQTFCIPFVGADDPDEDRPEVEPRRDARKQQSGQTEVLPQQPKAKPAESVADAIARLAGNKDARAQLKKLLCGAYDVVVLDDIEEKDVPAAIVRLEEYVAKAGQKKAA